MKTTLTDATVVPQCPQNGEGPSHYFVQVRDGDPEIIRLACGRCGMVVQHDLRADPVGDQPAEA